MIEVRRQLAHALTALLTMSVLLVVPFGGEAGAATSIDVKRNDYNRNGISDLVGIRHDNGCMYGFTGRTDGTFTQHGAFVGCGWENYQSVEAVGDMNGDGNGDLVGIRISDGCMARWKGTGDLGFTYVGTYGCGWNNYAYFAGVGDITRDGVPDLVAMRISDGCLARWRGSRSFGFTYIGDYGCGWDRYRGLEGLGDINRDGVGDLGAFRQSDGCFAVWYGTGTGGLNYVRDLQCGFDRSNVAFRLGDMNFDGIGDLAGTDVVTTSMLTWFGNGNGDYWATGQHFCCYGGDYRLT